MKRRKKSIIFSATLAVAGITAGSLIAISNKSDAAQLATMSLEDITSVLSADLKIETESVANALATKTIIAQVKDKSVLDNDPFIVNYGVITDDFYAITYDSARDTGVGYKLLSDDDAIENISLNYRIEVDRTTPSDPTNSSYAPEMMYLDRYADELASTTDTLKVAVLDTGILPSHEIFTETTYQDRLDLSMAKSFMNPAANGDIDQDGFACESTTSNYIDDVSHGTAVSGAIAQSTPRNVKIVPVKVLSSNKSENTMLNAYCGAAYVAGKVQVANMSLGAVDVITGNDAKTLDSFFERLSNKGTIFVAAAGNDSWSVLSYPAAAPSVIGITSVNSSNAFSEYSNHGVAADFAAPGQNMVLPSNGGNVEYLFGSGTSFSSPFVAASVANILLEHPTYTQAQVEKVLKLNAVDLGDPGWDQYFGYGSISFRYNRFADININIPQSTEWKKAGQTAYVTASVTSSSANITHRAILTGNSTDEAPTSWTALSAPSKSVTDQIPVTANGTYTVWYKNSNNEIKAQVFTYNHFDSVAPSIKEALKVASKDYTSAQFSITVQDEQSGLDKIEWLAQIKGTSGWQTYPTDYSGNETAAVVRTFTLDNLEADDYVVYAKIYDNAGNVTLTPQIEFTIEEQPDNVTVVKVATTPTSWTNGNVTVTANVTSDITDVTHRAIRSDSKEPSASEWVVINNPSANVNDSFTVSENGSYRVWYKNNKGNKASASFTVNVIDKTAPTITKALNATTISSDIFRLSISLEDSKSGIKEVTWSYKNTKDTTYTKVSDTYTGNSATVTMTHDFEDMELGTYNAYATIVDKAGNSASTDTIEFVLKEEEIIDNITISPVEVPDAWTKSSVNVTVKASSDISNIVKRALVEGSSMEPTDDKWTNVSSPAKNITETVNITKNGTYVIWYKNENGFVASEVFKVTKIDAKAPTIDAELKASKITKDSVTLTASASDEGGIAKVRWYYKLGNGAYKYKEDAIAGTDSLSIFSTEYTHTLSGLEAGEYTAYAAFTDLAGNEAKTPEINFEIVPEDEPQEPQDPQEPQEPQDPQEPQEPQDPQTPQEPEDPKPVSETPKNPKTADGIMIISAIGSALLATGAFIVAKLRRVR